MCIGCARLSGRLCRQGRILAFMAKTGLWFMWAKEMELKPPAKIPADCPPLYSFSIWHALLFCSGLCSVSIDISICVDDGIAWKRISGTVFDEILEEGEAESDPGPADTSALLLRKQPILVSKTVPQINSSSEKSTTSTPFSWLLHPNFSLYCGLHQCGE